MLSFLENNPFFYSSWIFILIFALHAGFITADIFKRGLLSRTPVWYGLTVTLPFAVSWDAVTLILTLLYGLSSDIGSSVRSVFLCLACAADIILTAVIYIRGHIKPVDPKSPELEFCGKEQLDYLRAKRLIITGIVSAAVFFTVSALILFPEAKFLTAGILWQGSVKETAEAVLLLLAFLLVPFINIIVFAYFCAIGVIFAEICFAMILVYAQLLLVTNGCIRLIAKSENTKGMKALLIILSFIPAFGVIYGIYSLKKAKERVTMSY